MSGVCDLDLSPLFIVFSFGGDALFDLDRERLRDFEVLLLFFLSLLRDLDLDLCDLDLDLCDLLLSLLLDRDLDRRLLSLERDLDLLKM